jgi:DNA-binding transcriptional ArsR family regulator
MVAIKEIFIKTTFFPTPMEGAQRKIVDLLRALEEDIPITQIATKTGIDRHTAAKHLEALKGKGIVESRIIGKSKMWKLAKSPFLEALKPESPISDDLKKIFSSIDAKVTVQRKDHEIIWDNTGKKACKCYEAHWNRTEKCERCPADKVLKTGKPTKIVLEEKKKTREITMHPIKDTEGKTIAFIEIVKTKKASKNG